MKKTLTKILAFVLTLTMIVDDGTETSRVYLPLLLVAR